jgi:zinc protease
MVQTGHFRRYRAGLALACAVLVFVTAPVATAQVHRHRLDNGMQILVKEDPRAPVVVSMMRYRAGSMDEVNGSTGVAHVLEHMMFKGTKRMAPGEFSRTIARAGGRDNATTTRDYTSYHQQLHKSQLALALELEADRMANLVLTQQEFEKEIRVVMEERRLRTEDQPRALLYEAFLATAYQAHPYRTPIVGWMQDLESMSVDDARAWYQSWYAPNNATLVVVGDVRADEVFAQAERWFGPLPARALPQRKPQREPVQRGTRRVSLAAPAELPLILMGWHVPVLRDVEADWEPYALWVLEAALDGNDAARLPQSLVRDTRVAIATNASYDVVNRGPALFVVSATPSAGHTLQQAEVALREELGKIAQDGITEDELKRTMAQAVAAQVFERDSMFGQAMRIGLLENAGLPPDSDDLQLRKLQEITAEQVQAVARKYFTDENLTVAVLQPQPLPSKAD